MKQTSINDPATQNIIAAAKTAIARAKEVNKASEVLIAKLHKDYDEIEARHKEIEQQLTADVQGIIQQMDKDTLQFLADMSSMGGQA
ncbi:MAG: hypothetical protein UX17_C0043G0007 [Parcubacteria group bacterium GW2011_GWC2_45_7]|nr:MAG: hypothetical protein UX17_C0043G0007 [Parcubacteria group bacterium GW2011_GWC2_45_7]KKU72123.1 MAG: hypothetical protein UX98_C0019G0007 [Parcubacteria group bacterium GW2011_GWA2_47_26]